MKIKLLISSFLIILCASISSALAPDEVLVVYNKNNPDSKRIADYYIQKRQVPQKNLFELNLTSPLADSISRKNYDTQIAAPIRTRLEEFNPQENIRCILLTYGIPYKVGAKIPTDQQKPQIEQLKKQAADLNSQVDYIIRQMDTLSQTAPVPMSTDIKFKTYSNRELSSLSKKVQQFQQRLEKLPNSRDKIDRLNKFNRLYQQLYGDISLANNLIQTNLRLDITQGKETNASVDSELSMVMYGDYNLYRWQPNNLKGLGFNIDFKTKMVCRLDGPDPNKIITIIDKSISTEQIGLTGIAYFDSKGEKPNSQFGSFGYVDSAIRNAATITRAAGIPTMEEKSLSLFGVNQCPRTALYCGWYSLKKYIDSFDFVDGAIGYHIASWEAVNLRDPNSTQWCPAMLQHGICATLGAVSEPYLHSFPEPDKFFAELINGSCLVEAFYKTKSLNSWQMLLIGDPLYRPFKQKK